MVKSCELVRQMTGAARSLRMPSICDMSNQVIWANGTRRERIEAWTICKPILRTASHVVGRKNVRAANGTEMKFRDPI